MSSRWAVVVSVVVLAVVACSGPAPDVTGIAGTPSGTAAPTRSPVQPAEVGSAPPCRDFPAAGDGLPCLGPGQPVAVRSLPGPTVVSVWASWCEPCRDELPVLQSYADAGGSVLGIAVASEPSDAAALLADLDVTFPSVQDAQSTTRAELGWVGPPANYVVVDGAVVHRFTAPITSVAQLRDAVAKAGG